MGAASWPVEGSSAKVHYLMNPSSWPSNVLAVRHRDGRDGCLIAGHGPKVFLVSVDKLDMYKVVRGKVEYEEYTTHRNLSFDWEPA